MRDKRRINKILKTVKKIRKKYPDLRLGQMLLNTVSDDSILYMLEDNELEQALIHVYLKDKDSI